jgi:hypothetical protein
MGPADAFAREAVVSRSKDRRRQRQAVRLFETPRPLCRKLSNPITFVARLRLDAALYEPAPPRRPAQIGRPRLKGKRLPDLSVVAECPSTRWEPVSVEEWYGGEERALEVVSDTAVWHSTGLLPAVPLRFGC